MFELLTQVGLPIALLLIMWGVGMSLTPADFRRVVQEPGGFWLGAAAQMLLLPLVALFCIYLFGLTGEVAIGLFILSLCPGGVTSNLYSYLCRGDVGLSVSLTALIGLVTPFTMPLLASWAIVHFSEADSGFSLPLVSTWLKLMLISVFPVLVGMLTRARWPELARRTRSTINIFSMLVLALLILSISVDLGETLWDYMREVGMAVLLLNILTMLMGYLLGRWLLHRDDQARTICLEVGLQNGTLALLITTGILQSSAMSVAPSVYSLLMFVTATLFTLVVVRRDRKAAVALS